MKRGKWDPEDVGCIFFLLVALGIMLTPIIAWWLPKLMQFTDWLYRILR